LYKTGSLDDVIGAVGTHEAVHATDKNSSRELGATEPEKIPNQEGLQYMKEVLKVNERQSR